MLFIILQLRDVKSTKYFHNYIHSLENADINI